MIVPSEFRHQYNRAIPIVADLGGRVEKTLSNFCYQRGFLFEGRVKSLVSCAQKLESGRFARWEELDDLYACTIVIPLLSDEEGVLDWLRDTFIRVKLTRRGQVPKPPDVFRFDSTRFIGKLSKPQWLDVGPYPTIYDLPFEVQVKTVFDFAWTRTMHALAYKTQEVDWRRLRLSAQLKAVLEQLDVVVAGFESTLGFVSNGHSPDVDDKSRIRAFFAERSTQGLIPSEVAPGDWSSFCDSLYRALQAVEGRDPSGVSGEHLACLSQALDAIDQHLKAVDPASFPRSVSLLQVVFGMLVQNGMIPRPEVRYYAPVTEALITLFPEVACVERRLTAA